MPLSLNKVHKMDCLKGLSLLKDNSIDVVITSPPYNKVGFEGFRRKAHPKDGWTQRNIEYDTFGDDMKEDDYQKWQVQILDEFQRVLKPDGSVFYNHKERVDKHICCHPLQWILKSKLTLRQQIVWDRGSSVALAPIRFIPSNELIFWLTKTPCQPAFNRPLDLEHKTQVWRICPEQHNPHPTPFPEDIPRNILRCIPKGGVVLDPFMGSGTTAKVAKELGFNFIGFELSDKYIQMTNERL